MSNLICSSFLQKWARASKKSSSNRKKVLLQSQKGVGLWNIPLNLSSQVQLRSSGLWRSTICIKKRNNEDVFIFSFFQVGLYILYFLSPGLLPHHIFFFSGGLPHQTRKRGCRGKFFGERLLLFIFIFCFYFLYFIYESN